MASKSYVAIANLALVGLGADTIMALDEDSKPARLINAIYELIRDEVLRAHPWNFAIRWSNLAQLNETPTNGYAYAYQLPTNPLCLKVIRLYETSKDFRVENGKLYTDYSTATLKYIAQITDPTEFDSAFITAYAARLAAEIAYALTGSQSVQEAKWKEYALKLQEARSLDSQEGKPDKREVSSWLSARGGQWSNEYIDFITE